MILFQCQRVNDGGLRVRRAQGKHYLRTGYVVPKATQEGDVVGWYEVRTEPARWATNPEFAVNLVLESFIREWDIQV
jgi:hypothetical protein